MEGPLLWTGLDQRAALVGEVVVGVAAAHSIAVTRVGMVQRAWVGM